LRSRKSGERDLRYQAGIGQMLSDEFAQSETFVQLPHQNQATIRRDSRSLEIDVQGAVEREFIWLVRFLSPRRVNLESGFNAFKPA